jgi:membrane protein YqaA with SNARE-associated domain
MFDYETMSLLGLFLVCFLSATILPFSSELAVVYFLNEGSHPIFSVLGVASLGNCLGGLTNYLLGFFGAKFYPPNLESKAFRLANRYGYYAAFFSWIPFIGDPLLLALGYLRSNPFKTITYMCLGKVLRYAFLGLFF